ncbi:hypothetical protein L6255_02800 [Candidatus Parcubacteria bacterium]|nr:hypothetical protein [Patescibacteria group bacterium]MCG2689344.1 hypothetical protein [Candidatus Parcubacteria bacterium]
MKKTLATIKEISNLEVPEVIKATVKASVEVLTAVYNNPKSALISLSNVAQRLIANEHLASVSNEWEKLKEQGRIKKTYESSLQARYTLLELLKFLEEGIPDKDRFEVMKRILLVTATEKYSTQEDLRPLEFMKIVSSLSSGAVILLLASYRLAKNPPPPMSDSTQNRADENEWIRIVLIETNLGYPELVKKYEDVLIKAQLITGRANRDGSGVRIGNHFRLTQLGYDLCEYIDHYEDFGLS